MNLFEHADLGHRLKEAGMTEVELSNLAWVQRAREIGLRLAAHNGEVTIEDVLKIIPRPEHVHPNAVGCVLRHKRLKLIGYTSASKASSHARKIGIYSLIS